MRRFFIGFAFIALVLGVVIQESDKIDRLPAPLQPAARCVVTLWTDTTAYIRKTAVAWAGKMGVVRTAPQAGTKERQDTKSAKPTRPR